MRQGETKFVVLSSQRSGSTWLSDVLNGHPGINAYGELFLPPKTDRPGGAAIATTRSADTEAYLKERLHDFPKYLANPPQGPRIPVWGPAAYLNKLYRQQGAVSFKLMYTQLVMFPSIWIYIAVRRLRVVHLVRRNHLDVVISSAISKATQTPRLIEGEKATRAEPVVLEPAGLIRRLRTLRRNIKLARRLLRLLLIPHLEVAYEDIAAGPARFDAVWQFLSIDDAQYEPRSDLVKLVKGDHADVIRNYSEVKEALATTEFAQMVR